MTENQEIENAETLLDVRIFRVPGADVEYWLKIVRAYGGNRQTAFRMLLDSFAIMTMLGKVQTDMQIVDERLSTLEQKWRAEGGNLPKTFGGV